MDPGQYVDLEQGYRDFNDAGDDDSLWDAIGEGYLDDHVILYDYHFDDDHPDHKVAGKENVKAALRRIRQELKSNEVLNVNPPPRNRVRLVPGAAAIDQLTYASGESHVCVDLFKFNRANGKVDEIHYCAVEGRHEHTH